MIRVRVDKPAFTGRVNSILDRAKKPEAVLLGMGREGGNILKRHFRRKDITDANKLNPDRRTHLWLEISRGVQAPRVAGSRKVEIDVNHPIIAQKVFGGSIVAKRGRNLSIPISPEAYGRTPATFERETGLKLFVLGMGGTKSNSRTSIVLAAALGNNRVQVEFLLTPRVNQKPDPTALPPEKELQEGVIARGQAMVDRENQN